MSDGDTTIIGPKSKVSVALIAVLASPAIWMISLMYEMKADMKGMKNEIEFIRRNSWTVSDMERYRFAVQIQNAPLGVKVPDVQEIIKQRPN